MKAISLGYHDVIEQGGLQASGFQNASAMHYKLDEQEFESHLASIARVRVDKPANVLVGLKEGGAGVPLHLTFDDGGSSALRTADILDRRGWVGHFMITTNLIGTPGFLTVDEIRELDGRGHVVGSHSRSHPARMDSLTHAGIFVEWNESIAVLSDITGKRVSVAAVPGGSFSARVAQGANEAGISALFTSEPTMRVHVLGGCRIYGRYSMRRGTSPALAASIASGQTLPRIRQFTGWNIRKAARRIGGARYLELRRVLLERGAGR